MSRIIKAAIDGGAAGAFLSGAGPTIIALTGINEMTIGFEMSEIATKSHVPGDIFVYSVVKTGIHIVSDETE
jgi:homoserine kinase